MVTSTSGALKNISNSLRKYLHKHPKIIFRINMEQGFHDSWLLSLSRVSCLSESRSLTPLCANFDNRINPRYLCWFLFALVFRNTHTKYWNIFCVFKTTSSLYVFRIENQLNKHCEKNIWEKVTLIGEWNIQWPVIRDNPRQTTEFCLWCLTFECKNYL